MRVIVQSSKEIKKDDRTYYINDCILFEKDYGEWHLTEDSIFSPEPFKVNSVYEVNFNRKGRLESYDLIKQTDIIKVVLQEMQS